MARILPKESRLLDLVTGASGFFGLNLCAQLLAKGGRVRVLLRDSSKKRFFETLPGLERLEFVPGDIRNPAELTAACQGVRYVYHSAAAVSSWSGQARTTFETNVGGTQNVIAAAQAAGVQRLVHISTIDAFGIRTDGQSADETTPWNYDQLGLSNPYSNSKYDAHRLAEAAAATLDVVLVSPGYMIGPMDWQLSSNALLLAVADGKLGIATHGGNAFVHVHDVVDLAIAAAERGQRGRSYIGAGENLSYQAFFEQVAEAMGKPKRFLRLPTWVAFIGGFWGGLGGRLLGREPDLHLNIVRMATIPHYYSADRAKAELGFAPRPISQAIAESIAWFRSKGML